jgi:hypothetical protein
MQMFIDNSEASPASRKEGMSGNMLNTVMHIPASSHGGFIGFESYNFKEVGYDERAMLQLPTKSIQDRAQDLLQAKLQNTLFLLHHSFRKSSDVDGHWKATYARDMEKFFKDIHEEGFHFHAFLPTARAGPFYCLWEAAPGKTEQDMQMFIDNSEASPASRKEGMSGNMLNTVMLIPASLHAGHTGLQSFNFGAKALIQMSESDTERSLLGAKNPDGFYFMKHTFRKSSDVDGHWKATYARDMEKFFKDIHKEGFHFHSFLPTARAGPFYCLWEAAPGKTERFFELKKFRAVSFHPHPSRLGEARVRGQPYNSNLKTKKQENRSYRSHYPGKPLINLDV